MDPETAKLVAAITGSAGVLGAILGASIAALSGWIVAKTNMAAQRAIAQDNARRERRERHVRGLVELVNKRPSVYADVREAVRLGDGTRLKALRQRMVDEESPLAESVWLALQGFPDDGPVAAFYEADRAFLDTALAIVQKPRETDAELIEAQARSLHAMAALVQAAERYIDGD